MKAALFLSGDCNLGCSYCYATGCEKKPMTRETLGQSLAFLRQRASGSLSLSLLGGEPLLWPDLVDDVIEGFDRLDSMSLALGIGTNGTLLSEAFLERCRRKNIQLLLSLDGVREAHDTHRRFQDGRGSFKAVMARVPEVLACMPATQVCSVVTPRTAHLFGDSVQFLFDQGFRRISTHLDYGAAWTARDMAVLAVQYARVTEAYKGWIQDGREFWLSFLDDPIRTWVSGSSACGCCELADKMLAIGPEGRLYPCVQFAGSGLEQQGIGNVWDGLDPLARQKVLCQGGEPAYACTTCSLGGRCPHRCGCTNWRVTGSLGTPPPSLCAHTRMVVPLADALASELFERRNPVFLDKFYGSDNLYPSTLRQQGIRFNGTEP